MQNVTHESTRTRGRSIPDLLIRVSSAPPTFRNALNGSASAPQTPLISPRKKGRPNDRIGGGEVSSSDENFDFEADDFNLPEARVHKSRRFSVPAINTGSLAAFRGSSATSSRTSSDNEDEDGREYDIGVGDDSSSGGDKPMMGNMIENWLSSNFEDGSWSIPRGAIYSMYTDTCKAQGVPIAGCSYFGKVMKRVFPSVKFRRLGQRGLSKYYYQGIGPRQTSPYFEPFQPYRITASPSAAAPLVPSLALYTIKADDTCNMVEQMRVTDIPPRRLADIIEEDHGDGLSTSPPGTFNNVPEDSGARSRSMSQSGVKTEPTHTMPSAPQPMPKSHSFAGRSRSSSATISMPPPAASTGAAMLSRTPRHTSTPPIPTAVPPVPLMMLPEPSIDMSMPMPLDLCVPVVLPSDPMEMMMTGPSAPPDLFLNLNDHQVDDMIVSLYGYQIM